MKKEQDNTIERLIRILGMLTNGERVTTKDLADEFSVSVRTIQIDLNQRLSFLPIQKENGTYSLERYALGKLSFEDIKNFATLSGLNGLYPTLEQSFIVDILNERVNKALLIKGGTYEPIDKHLELFEQIELAIIQHRKIAFNYKEKARVVEPYKLMNTNNIWYLLATENGDLKSFTFTKLQNFILVEESFKPNQLTLDTINKDDTTWYSKNSIQVTLEVDAVAAEYFLRRDLLPAQVLLKQNGNGLTLSTKVAYDDEILQIVKQWIPHIKITSPEYLQEKLHQDLTHYLATSF